MIRARAIALAAGVVFGALGGLGALTPVAAAPPHKILVLPADGAADPATRGKLTAQLARLARRLDGQVSTGDATFADTALAVGCAPEAAGCSDEVMTTLGVDELVWATTTRDAGATRATVRRAAKGSPTREQGLAITASAPVERAEAELAPLFGPPEPAPPPEPIAAAPPAAPAPAPPAAPETDRGHRDRTTGILFGVGGGVALILGAALWFSYSDLQDQIDHHSTRTRGDLDDLLDLEDRAQNRAIAGDILVVVGAAAGGLAAYYLLRDHHTHGIAIAPTPIGHGGGLGLTITGGL